MAGKVQSSYLEAWLGCSWRQPASAVVMCVRAVVQCPSVPRISVNILKIGFIFVFCVMHRVKPPKFRNLAVFGVMYRVKPPKCRKWAFGESPGLRLVATDLGS
eukprot:7863189-Lingulodinium_polyedra.AAC.1